jgi:hypothetical protein
MEEGANLQTRNEQLLAMLFSFMERSEDRMTKIFRERSDKFESRRLEMENRTKEDRR